MKLSGLLRLLPLPLPLPLAAELWALQRECTKLKARAAAIRCLSTAGNAAQQGRDNKDLRMAGQSNCMLLGSKLGRLQGVHVLACHFHTVRAPLHSTQGQYSCSAHHLRCRAQCRSVREKARAHLRMVDSLLLYLSDSVLGSCGKRMARSLKWLYSSVRNSWGRSFGASFVPLMPRLFRTNSSRVIFFLICINTSRVATPIVNRSPPHQEAQAS